jgi:hypothetical protein
VNNATIDATGGNHMVLISGNTDTFNLSGGTEQITDSGTGGNTFRLPTAGNGSLHFTNPVLNSNDVFDLSSTLAGTGWDGSAGSLGSYLHTKYRGGNTDLFASTSASKQASGTLVAAFNNQDVKLSTILMHSIT